MKLANKSFSRPVVGNSDDVAAAFQVPIEVELVGPNVQISAIFQNGSEFLRKLIKKGRAAYQIHVECSSTFFRESFSFSDDNSVLTIPRAQLFGRVDVSPVIVSCAEIKDYIPDDAHADYSGLSFFVEPGDVLAVAEPSRFDIDIAEDDLKKINSIMKVRIDEGREDGEMSIQLSGSKICVFLPSKAFQNYLLARRNSSLKSVVGMLIALPALSEAVRAACKDDSEFSDCKWFRCVRRRMAELAISPKLDPLEIAQRLLANPVSRSLDACVQSFGLAD
jgi:hypothetical protein